VAEPNNKPEADAADIDHFDASCARPKPRPARSTGCDRRGKERRNAVASVAVTFAMSGLDHRPAANVVMAEIAFPMRWKQDVPYPYSDFLLHDVGTGRWHRHRDGGALRQAMVQIKWKNVA